MQPIKTQQAMVRTTTTAQPTMTVIKPNKVKRQTLPRDKAVAEAARRTG